MLFIGCSTKTLPSTNRYTLELTNQFTSNTTQTQQYNIKILEPLSTKLYNNTNIYYSDKSFTIYPYVLNKWSNYPTKMIQQQLVMALDKANLYNSVTTDMINGKFDFVLQSELLKMVQLIEKNSAYSVLKIKFYILNKYNQNISTKTFEYKIKNDSINAYGAIKAYNQALNQLTNDLFIWLQNKTKDIK
jgi:cholesterol transport system auxiliary component